MRRSKFPWHRLHVPGDVFTVRGLKNRKSLGRTAARLRKRGMDCSVTTHRGEEHITIVVTLERFVPATTGESL